MAALATVEDLEARLGRELTGAEADRAEVLLDDASALVRGYTRQEFTAATTAEVLPVVADRVVLPQRPVTAVASVKALVDQGDGTHTKIRIPFSWDGLDQVTWDLTVVINAPEILREQPTSSVEVTYTHGYPQAPADIVATVCVLAARQLTAPATAGLRSVTVGGYSESYADGYTSGSMLLTDADRAILNRYRRTATTVGLAR